MARRVRAEAKPLTRCPYGHAPLAVRKDLRAGKGGRNLTIFT